nr:discoidin domain-containing protein [Paenibacillus sp. 19GGS1-52]
MGFSLSTDKYFSKLTAGHFITVTASSSGEEVGHLAGNDDKLCWRPSEDDKEPWVEIVFPEAVILNGVILQEQILQGQRVEAFELWSEHQQQWSKIAEGTIVGYKKIIRVSQTRADRVKVVFKKFREFPTLAHIRVVNTEDYQANLFT